MAVCCVQHWATEGVLWVQSGMVIVTVCCETGCVQHWATEGVLWVQAGMVIVTVCCETGCVQHWAIEGVLWVQAGMVIVAVCCDCGPAVIMVQSGNGLQQSNFTQYGNCNSASDGVVHEQFCVRHSLCLTAVSVNILRRSG
jgi:hypothetical protein